MSLFSYDSPPMQLLGRLTDLIIMNLLFILCSLPIFTIGAAQAGLYTACKVFQDPADDTSLSAAFFRGFVSGFGTVTVVWGAVTLFIAGITYMGLTAIYNGAPLWIIAVGICICLVIQCAVPLFHSRFGCTKWQLLRNAFFFVLAHPLQCILTAALIWLPVILFLVKPFIFMALLPIWAVLYYSTAAMTVYTLMKKPFGRLINEYNKANPAEDPSTEDKPEKIFSDEIPV